MIIELELKQQLVCKVQCLCCHRRYETTTDITEVPEWCDYCITPSLRVLTSDITMGQVNA